jgi:hypothetical protein
MTERAYLTEIASRQCCRKAFSHNQDPDRTLTERVLARLDLSLPRFVESGNLSHGGHSAKIQ